MTSVLSVLFALSAGQDYRPIVPTGGWPTPPVELRTPGHTPGEQNTGPKAQIPAERNTGPKAQIPAERNTGPKAQIPAKRNTGPMALA